MTTAMPSSASAMPSRRWPGSSSRARPTERAVDPAPLASTSQPARKPRPTVAPADETADELRRTGLRRAAEGRAGRDPPFDLLERAPDRAAVLLGMTPSLVASVPYSPSATRVTERSQLHPSQALPCRNDDIPGRDHPSHLEQGAVRCLRRDLDRRDYCYVEPERRVFRRPRWLRARLLQRLQGHARIAVADGRHRAVLPRRRHPDG